MTPWTTARQASLSITNFQNFLKLMSIQSVMPSNNLILCYPLLLLPSVFPSIKVFSNESAVRIRWPKYRSFSFNISPSNEYSGLISFRTNWFDLLLDQGTLKSLLQRGLTGATSPRTDAVSASVPMAGHYLPTPVQETLKHSQVGLSQSPGSHCSFPLGPDAQKILFCLCRLRVSVSPSPVEAL